jgi:hypothetical protein
LIAGCAFVALGVWLSSGTMTPYAFTQEQPHIIKPCNYLGNTDHWAFEATYFMLDGRPRETWDQSTILRRTLFPIIAYPAMKIFGFLKGGVLTSLILQIAAFAGFVIYVRRRIGEVAAYVAMALLATYPGIYYWAGLPYSYAAIVPATLCATMIVRELETVTPLARIAILSLLLGILFLAYDLMAYFAPAAVLVLLGRRKYRATAVAAVLLVIPTLVNNWILAHVAHLDFRNENSRFYSMILGAYLHPPALAVWARHVSPAGLWLVRAFFFSNFTFLPAVFWIALVARFCIREGQAAAVRPAVRWVLLTALGLFLFINLAPPYRGWQFRGDGISRIYQPTFAAMILFIAGVAQELRRWLTVPAALAAAINASIVLGPLTLNPLAGWAYLRFYAHAPSPQMYRNLVTFGRRPLGICDKSIKLDNPPPRVKHKTSAKAKTRKHPTSAKAPASVPSARADAAALCRDG